MNSRILPALALLLAVGMFFVYVNPMWSGSIAETKAAIAADDQALQTAQQYAAQQSQLAAARDGISQADRTALATFLPSSVDNVGLILDLDALAARSGLSVTSMDVAGAADQSKKDQESLPGGQVGPVASVDLSFAASGPFSALETFLTGLEKSARILDVKDITVKGSDTGVYAYQMTITLYWLR